MGGRGTSWSACGDAVDDLLSSAPWCVEQDVDPAAECASGFASRLKSFKIKNVPPSPRSTVWIL
jgi:hypothetical protein